MQRGYYSEYLGSFPTDDLLRESTSGPMGAESSDSAHVRRQRPPLVSSFRSTRGVSGVTLSSAASGDVAPASRARSTREAAGLGTAAVDASAYVTAPSASRTRGAAALHVLAQAGAMVGVPASALEPKVMSQFKTAPGKTPRKIEIERRKREYAAQDLEELLAAQGVDYRLSEAERNASAAFPSYLPLEPFDDTEFEVRTPREWLELGVENGVMCGVPGAAVVFDSAGCGSWVPVLVVDYSAEAEAYVVVPRGATPASAAYSLVHRIHLYFVAESPANFAARVGAAHRSRRDAEALLRYNLYIDSMPTAELPSMTQGTVNRILEFSVAGAAPSASQLTLLESLLSQVGVDYARAMNKIIFDTSRKDPAQHDQFAFLTLPPDPEPAPVPLTGAITIPGFDYEAAYSGFTFLSFLTKSEVIATTAKVRTECNKVLQLNLFNNHVTKSLRLDEFETMQNQAAVHTLNHLKDNWKTNLKNAIRGTLKDVGKGWFNLNEKSREVYEISKLKKFMVMVKFVMQDTLRSLALDSLTSFHNLVVGSAPVHVDIASPGEVDVVFGSTPMPAAAAGLAAHKYPLFAVDLVVRDGQLVYSTKPSAFEEVPILLFERAISLIQDLPQLEPEVLQELFWATKPVLESVSRHDPVVLKLRAAMVGAVARSTGPLDAYLAQYDEYAGLIALDPLEAVRQLEDDAASGAGRPLTTAYLAELIQDHRVKQAELEELVPRSINIGMFRVSCELVRNMLIRKRRDLGRLLLDLLARRTRAKADTFCEEFEAVAARLQVRPTKIEELVDMEKFLSSVPLFVDEHLSALEELNSDYAVLEEFRYNLPPDDFNRKWAAAGWPKSALEMGETTTRVLEKDRARFEKDLVSDQEAFAERLEELARAVASLTKYTKLDEVDDAAADVAKLEKQIAYALDKVQLFHSREVLFERELTDYDEVSGVVKQFEPYQKLWTTTASWLEWHQSWMHGPFSELDAKDMQAKLTAAWSSMFKLVKVFKDAPGCLAVATSVKGQMDAFKPHVPLIMALRNRGMRDRHWETLEDNLGMSVRPTDDASFAEVATLGLEAHLEAIEEVAGVASREYGIESELDSMLATWESTVFEIVEYGETETYILRGTEPIIQLLDDHIVMTQAMSFSAYREPFEDRIGKWEKKLELIQETIEEWLLCQKQWLYLQPIFSSDDINRQMVVEGKRFATMDRMWRKNLGSAAAAPGVLAVCKDAKLLDSFRECIKLLDLVQKGLTEYLETKRAIFPRFYFLSDDEMLEILSQTRDPTAVQKHLSKCFENIGSLTFGEDNIITAMSSGEGETVPFIEHFYPKGNVENWLLEVERVMKLSVRDVIKKAVGAYPKMARTEWVAQWPAQAVLVVAQIYWTQQVTAAIRTGTLPKLHAMLVQQIDELTMMVRSELPKLVRKTISPLIILDVHARDVTARLAEAHVDSVTDFEWMSQMRQYWEDSNAVIKMVNTSFVYGYEYLGNTGRLVITPLTDRCYLTLTGALHLQMGGAPQGPAGTGKTETTKDLAKALAKQCVVFNCQGTLDHIAMGKFFKGLASAGAWACFDEFNRIELEVLSVIATQILQIQRAIQTKQKRFLFEGAQIALDPTCAIFITMNPGYAGRAELPDNLKALFRPVAMMVPDYAMIAEIMLFSFGFSEASQLSRKMTATFRLSSEQLSSQSHYDFGMRAVKTVISAAGNLKRADPSKSEEIILLKALKDCNVPKFLAEDLVLFNGIISDLFPGVVQPQDSYGALESELVAALKAQGLQPAAQSIHKCIQLYETTVVRHGLMLVGPTGGGKTVTYRTLARAMTALAGQGPFTKVHYDVINPKSITMEQLYGFFDPNTHEWTEGVLANIIREGAESETGEKRWTVFDGPVDALWIENMNTVLDDNKKLCLSSGKIIRLSDAQTMMFEVEDLAVASPATVSRCGMVYMEPSGLGLQPLIDSWLAKLSPASLAESVAPVFAELFNALALPALAFVRSSLVEPVPTVDNNLLQSLMRLLDAFMASLVPPEGGALPQAAVDRIVALAPALFVFALVWSIGATSDAAGRSAFDAHLRDALVAAGPLAASVQLPGAGLVYDWFLDFAAGLKVSAGGAASGSALAETHAAAAAAGGESEGSGSSRVSWVPWMDTIPPYAIKRRTAFADIIVPTIDSVRYTYMLDVLLQAGSHVLCVGPTGTGKSSIVGDKVIKHMDKNFESIVVTFSAQTSENMTQDILDSKFTRRRRTQYGPPAGKRFVIFVDDLNMPAKDEYGSQGPIELLRQWMDHGGWYDRSSLTFLEIVDIVFVGALGPPGGGRSAMTPRFKRHFNLLSFTELSRESMSRVFTTIMDSFFGSFVPEVASLTKSVVEGTISVYASIQAELRPTPSRSHYTYNLRDLSKVVEGVVQASREAVQSRAELVALWAHECTRVFHDRLVDAHDREWFKGELKKIMASQFGMRWLDVAKDLGLAARSSSSAAGAVSGAELDDVVYARVEDMSVLLRVVEEYLEEYNATQENPMNLVMFNDAIAHISRIVRTIRQPQGNCLLLGMGGSGRRSLARLAAFIAGYEVFSIEISKSYGVAEWHEDLRRMFMLAGVEGKSLVFLFADSQIVHESFLEDISNILNAGVVPNIFGPEEEEAILETMRPVVQNLGIKVTKTTIFDHFVKRLRANIHCVLAMSPIGNEFRTRIRMFPSLIACTTIDWFSRWPLDALESVANKFLAPVAAEYSPAVHAAMVDCAATMHESVVGASAKFLVQAGRFNYVTPASYLELLNVYESVKKTKAEAFETRKARLEVGLQRLVKTRADVEVLQEDLEAMQPGLVQLQKEVESTMIRINGDKESAAKSRVVVMQEEEEARKKARECEDIAASAKRDLDEALPALDAALVALSELDRTDLVEIKAMQNPPAGVKMVMSATCIMFGKRPQKVDVPGAIGKKQDDYWPVARQLLSNPMQLLNSMYDFPKDNIPEATIAKIQPYIEDPDFEPEKVVRVSVACKSICMWVRAMEKYHQISKVVAPKRQAHAEAKASLDATLLSLKESQDKLAELEGSILELEQQYEDSVKRKEDLQAQVEKTKQHLARAHKLIGGLADEKDRWKEGIADIEGSLHALVGDALLAAAVIGYLGAFTTPFREELVAGWLAKMGELDIPHTPSFSIRTVLGSAIELRAWNLAGLPNDTLSTENGVIVKYSRRWALMIDPQGQANKWIRNMEAENGLDVIKLSEKDYLRTLGNAIRFGKPVLLENVPESLDPALEPVLLKQVVERETGPCIKVGDQEIPYRDDFRLYITTKLPNPHYKPETSTKVTLLNFTLSPEGLEEQLLGVVVAKERPDLEDTKNHLVSSNAKMRQELAEIEDRILFLLSSAKGNPLEDEVLIDELANSKKVSLEIKQKVVEQEETEVEIDATRRQYQPVAVRARILFFCITDLAAVDPMYQYSLNWFMGLFSAGLANSEPDDELGVRLNNISEYFTYSLYRNVCRSLFERHKVLFSFLLCTRILRGAQPDYVDADEWRFLLGGSSLILEESKSNPAPEWLTQVAWEAVQKLELVLPRFSGFTAYFVRHIEFFAKYFNSSAPHKLELPGLWQERLNAVQRIALLRCLRLDKVAGAVEDFIAEELGKEFIIPPTFDLASVYRDSSPTTPLIFVLSPGADPGADLYKFAVEMRFSKKLATISLGRGQGVRAEEMIAEAMERGTWVLLENCHLATSWMPDLERIVVSWQPEKIHRDFRLWLTSMPSPEFPVVVLQESVKMTNEPPKGVRSNLLRTYASLEEGALDDSKNPRVWRKLLYSLAMFHAVIQERRKFGPLGWNIPYEYTRGDLAICIRQLHMFLEAYPAPPYRVLKFLAGHINYGGRVTDDIDRRTLMTILGDFYTPEVLDSQFRYAGDDVYANPEADTVKGVMDFVEALPHNDPPHLFGMHENADITFVQNEVAAMFAAMVKLQPAATATAAVASASSADLNESTEAGATKGADAAKSASAGASLSVEDKVKATAVEVLERVPGPLDESLVSAQHPLDPKESMSTVLIQEVMRYNALLRVVKQSLGDLLDALDGLVVMSLELEEMGNSLYHNQVPKMWETMAYPSLKPLSAWVVDLVARMEFIAGWAAREGNPTVYWISGFFFPQAFLTGTLQNYARKYLVSVDTLSFEHVVMTETKAELEAAGPPEDGCYISGLYMEGARWSQDAGAIVDSRSKELYTLMPVIWLKPVPDKPKPSNSVYVCPVYKTLARAGELSTTGHSTNYITSIELPIKVASQGEADDGDDELVGGGAEWVKKGVAMFCALNY
ncbi:dynein heavy chain 2 [Thecamonas trahens ATCC 50062]|uniref:Dynein heavy chain 2 n=1 Tax=Thecamonas trahens ATCC 50062 TaxID=461836 RepID=A0A0L0DRK6_THETB|nr:dynein heavy chain 2 [Thecamonas trahens ATCC 50062]KNC54636.1 dynein heavy chain 2 [Thecamonas trahens ATCC 50062]|eukprot:XP_013761543.1 dynein heavy chain 2 [Thecamonas trahens ATCC 50062]